MARVRNMSYETETNRNRIDKCVQRFNAQWLFVFVEYYRKTIVRYESDLLDLG